MSAGEHDTYAELDGTSGECDDCHCIAPQLYRLGCEAGCFDGEDAEGFWRYCSTCVRRGMRRHDPIGAA
jgi:hypothetical protein